MPDIIAFYESEEGKKIFEEWKAKRQEEQKQNYKPSWYNSKAAESNRLVALDGAFNMDNQSKKTNPNSSVVTKQFGFACFGGPEGSRTPVRKPLDTTFSGCSLLFKFPLVRRQQTDFALG